MTAGRRCRRRRSLTLARTKEQVVDQVQQEAVVCAGRGLDATGEVALKVRQVQAETSSHGFRLIGAAQACQQEREQRRAEVCGDPS